MRALVALAAFACWFAAPAWADDPVYVLLKAGTLIDGTGAAPRTGVDVLVKDGKISQVGAHLAAPAKATVIDFSGYTVLPGFIDCHTHLTTGPDGPGEITRTVTEGPADAAIRGVTHARETIEAGFTTVRNVGASQFVDVALKRAIDRGEIVGPRMITATNALSIVGGHGDVNFLQPGILEEHLDYTEGLPTGPDECRKAVRYAHKHGAGVIKIMSTGGVLSSGTTLAERQFSDEELHAIVDEATLLGLKVCCHAHGAAGIKAAVKAGVASIEHGTFLDDECIRLMKERGTYLVPTRSAGEWVYAKAKSGALPSYTIAKAMEVGPVMRGSFQKAYRAGIKIAFGTDAGVFPHGQNAKEFAYMTDLGMKPMEAIVTATSSASDLLGWNEVGEIAPGRFGDFVVVAGDPLADIHVLERPVAVLKGGAFVKDDRARDSAPQAGVAAGR
jgi:imidazolonepropionase-like amidohydrolase